MSITLETIRPDGDHVLTAVPKDEVARFRKHLTEIAESVEFRSSHRSAQFLRYICEQALAGHSEALKERTIGVELFGRSPDYDTGEDSIVRVTASDVRKRLSHFYLSAPGFQREMRISLPVGSYVPRFTCVPLVADENLTALPDEPAANSVAPKELSYRRNSKWLWAAMISVLVAAALLLFWTARRRTPQYAGLAVPGAPWSWIFAEKRPPLFVTSDPNIAEIQGLTNQPVSPSDYANGVYIPRPDALSPLLLHICRDVLRGDKAASVDTPIVASVAELAALSGTRIKVRAARDLHFSDLDTDSNLIFLGSPRTNPWTSLFDEQLDFRFHFETTTRQDIILNAHPRPGESSQYLPTAKGFYTGQSFATISFVRNANHPGNVLLLAGADAEGTRAAGQFVSNQAEVRAALAHCGINPLGGLRHFQILLHLQTMAGSPTAFDVAACHALP